MSDGGEWISWVGPARKGDAAAIEQLEQYFTPFVHAVVLSRVGHHLAGKLIKPVLAHAVRRLSGLTNDAGFGAWVLGAAREHATEVAKTPGATTERANNLALNSGLEVLAKIRLLTEASSERLLMRLLEGIPGFEIAEVVGGSQIEVRAELERAAETLVQQLTAQSVSFAADSYLWSLVGTPHPALIPLENQLTALRFDPGSVADPDATPAAPQRSPAASKSKPEGQRSTSESLIIPKPTETTEPSGGELKTTLNALPVPVPAVASDPVNNPFGTSVKTIGVADLPAAADFADLQPGMGPTVVGEEESPPTQANLMPVASGPIPKLERDLSTKARPSGPRSPPISVTANVPIDDPDSTSIRPYPKGDEENTKVPVPRKSGAWRSSNVVSSPPRSLGPIGVATVTVAGGSLSRSWRPFAISSVFGVIAMGVAALLFDGTTKRVRLGWELTPVVVAAADMPEGTVITPELIAERSVPEAFVTSSVIKPESTQYLLNQRILVPAQAGDPMLWTEFEVTRANERLSSKVTKHARAYDLMTNQVIAVGGWVQPNDRIDLIANVKPSAEKGSNLAITVLQDVTVLSTGKITAWTPSMSSRASDRDYVDISLLLLPEEAEIVALANEIGELQLTLRTDDDHEVMTDHRGTSSKTLLQGERVRLLQVKRSAIIQQVRSGPKPR